MVPMTFEEWMAILEFTDDELVVLREAKTIEEGDKRLGWNAGYAAGVAAERERNAETLREYGRHSEGCMAQYGYRCRCGWSEVAAEAK